jgi:large subunit ribosomal protein L35
VTAAEKRPLPTVVTVLPAPPFSLPARPDPFPYARIQAFLSSLFSTVFRARFPEDSAMPKQKTHKGVKKRFRITARGKVKHRRAGTSHLQVRLTSKRKRKLRGTGVLAVPETSKIVEMLGRYRY